MPRIVHLFLALIVASTLCVLGAWLLGRLPIEAHVGLGLGLLWGVTVGMSVVAYWEEVIDR